MMTKIGYKLFRVKKNSPEKLYPLYVFADKEIPMNVWLDAESGPKNSETGKVKSKLGDLAYRPGWHINDKVPHVTHIYSVHDGVKYLRDDCVWCEVEYNDGINYQEKAHARGIHKNGKFVPRDAYIEEVPVGGYYRYKTNPNMFGEWIIAGEMKVNRIMSDEEVERMCLDEGLEPLVRYKKS